MPEGLTRAPCSGIALMGNEKLVDGVIPDVPTRQWPAPNWPWSMPLALRLHLAADPDLCRDVASAFINAVFASYVRGARMADGLDAPGSLAHPGAVPSV